MSLIRLVKTVQAEMQHMGLELLVKLHMTFLSLWHPSLSIDTHVSNTVHWASQDQSDSAL